MNRPAALAALAFALFAALYALDRPAYVAILGALHIHPFAHPFLDTRFVTAQVQCFQAGIDVYARNPCDPLGRTMDYSPLWLHLGFLGQSSAATPFFGLAIDLAFLASLFAIPWAPRAALDRIVAAAAVLSWSTLYALERGNTDLLMFAATVAFAHLAVRSAPARVAGLALVLGVGMLKFFPLCLLVFVARERRRTAWIAAGLCVLAIAVFAACFHAGLARIGANMADSLFGDMFGARSLPFGLPLLLGHVRIRDASGTYVGAAALRPAMHPQAYGGLVLLCAACVLAAVRISARPALRTALDRLAPASRAVLLAGAVLVAFCFFAHQNIGYRAVFLLLVLPGLQVLGGLGRATSLAVLLVLWGGIVSRSTPGWFVLQLAWWWIACVLLAVAWALLGRDVLRVIRPGEVARA